MTLTLVLLGLFEHFVLRLTCCWLVSCLAVIVRRTALSAGYLGLAPSAVYIALAYSGSLKLRSAKAAA